MVEKYMLIPLKKWDENTGFELYTQYVVLYTNPDKK